MIKIGIEVNGIIIIHPDHLDIQTKATLKNRSLLLNTAVLSEEMHEAFFCWGEPGTELIRRTALEKKIE